MGEEQVWPGGEPDVSVVVPTHDVGEWVDECLSSLLDDQGVALEVVVVDDRSTDDTWERVTSRALTDPRLRVVRSTGSGGGQARNYGAALARGKFLVFCDGDDLVPAGALEAMLSSLSSSGSDMVVGDFLKFSPMRTWSPTARWNVFTERRAGITIAELPALLRNRACWNRMFRRDFWVENAIAFPSVPRSNDIVPMTTALLAARTIDVVPDVVYLYRERPGASSMTSRAGSSTSAASYLSQELVCAQLVAGAGDEGLAAVYWSLFLGSDGWVHVRRFVREPEGAGAVEPDVCALLDQHLHGVRARQWDRTEVERQAVYTLVRGGRVDLARAVLLTTGEEDVAPVPLGAVRAAEVLAELHRSGHMSSASLRTFADRHLVAALLATPAPLDAAVAARLLDLVRPLADVLRPPATDDESAPARRLRESLAAGDLSLLVGERPTIPAPVTVSSYRVASASAEIVVDLPGPVPAGATFTVVKPGRPSTRRPLDVVEAQKGSRTRRVVVTRSDLASEGTWAVELEVSTWLGTVYVPLLVDAPSVVRDVTRWGPLTVRRKKRGLVPVTVVRRPPLPRRALRRLERGLHR